MTYIILHIIMLIGARRVQRAPPLGTRCRTTLAVGADTDPAYRCRANINKTFTTMKYYCY